MNLHLQARETDILQESIGALFDALPIPVARCLLTGEVEAVSASLRDLLALGDDTPDSCWSWFLGGDGPHGVRARVLSDLDAIGSADLDASAQRSDGTSVVVHVSVRRLAPASMVLAIRPIDSEIRQAAKLRASQDRFEKLAGSVPAGIISSQAGMRVDYANQRCCEVFGAPSEVLFGFGWLEYVHRDDVDAVERAVADAIADSTEAHLPVRVVRTDGTVRWVEVKIAPVTVVSDVGFVATITDVTEAREMTSLLTTQARHDPLTGLPNRAALREILTDRLRQEGPLPAVLFVDLDHFKNVNDSLGHAAGDGLLSVVARRLQHCVRVGDTVARFGGDEFVIVLEPGDGPGAVDAVAERIVRAMRRPVDVSGHSMTVTASVGIVGVGGIHAGDAPVDVDAVLRDADIAMYQAKRAGRNRSATFDEQVRAGARQRLTLHTALQRALEEDSDELTMVYQPIISMSDGETRGVEALMRWDLPGHGRVSPTVFVPLAEETGLIARLGRRALAHALDDVARWRRAGSEELWVSVNLSAHDLVEPDLVAVVATALADRGLPGQALQLELTESAMMTDPEHAQHVLSALQRLGVSIAVDDFGTGYSSLAYLQRLPVDAVKIDRAFVERIGVDAPAAALIEAIIAVSKALGLTVIAEGVERVDQAQQLQALGAEFAQGFLFSHPLSAEAVDDGVPAVAFVG